MTVTVADLLTEPVLAESRVLAGADGLSRLVRDLTWYHGQELSSADAHLVVCDPVHVHPPYRVDALLRRAESANASGLLIAAPGAPLLLSTIRLADRLGMPVLSVEGRNLVDLLHSLTVRIRTPELARARMVEDLVHRLRKKTSGTDIVNTIGRLLAQRITLIAPDGTAIVGEPVVLPPDLRFDLAVTQCSELTADGGLLIHPIIEPDTARPTAWLAGTVSGRDEAARKFVTSAFAVSEPFLYAWLINQRAVAAKDMAIQAKLLTEVIDRRDAVSRYMAETAVSLGWRLPDWHVGIHLICEDVGPGHDREDLSPDLREALKNYQLDTTAMIDRGDGWATWITSEAQPPPADGRRIRRALRLALASLPRELAIVAGIGRPHNGPAGLADTLSEARDAAALAHTHEHRPAVEHVDELGVTRLLAGWQRSEALQAFAESALAPILGVDNGRLVSTLGTYLEAGASVGRAAEVLGLHRNTVAARLHQVRERLEVDLDDPNQRLALQMACRALGRS